jgi:hypothetical protein
LVSGYLKIPATYYFCSHDFDCCINFDLQMVPEIAFGQHTRIALDIGCGVASFGAFLLQRNVTTLSIAPKDVHENQIQFALERGVPAMAAVFSTRRLLYPSQAFDLIHCSRCRIDWTRDGTFSHPTIKSETRHYMSESKDFLYSPFLSFFG